MNDDERRRIVERVRVEEGEKARMQGVVAGIMAFGSGAVTVGLVTYLGSASGCMAENTVFQGELLAFTLACAAGLIFVRARR